MPIVDFIEAIPKVELHSHLHGSIPQDLLVELLAEKKKTDPSIGDLTFDPFTIKSERDLDTCFKYFDVVHKVVDNAETLKVITDRVLSDFAKDQIKYLELRTTPRVCQATGLTVEKYLETIYACSQECELKTGMKIRLILSVNRTLFSRETLDKLEAHMESLAALAAAYPSFVVGIDVSGNPVQGEIRLGLKALHKWMRDPSTSASSLRDKGITIHTGEVKDDKEIDRILEFRPDRLGHCCHLTAAQRKVVSASVDGHKKMHVEFCPTSNYCTMGLAFMEDHHYGTWRQADTKDGNRLHCSISADDTGLFSTTTSDELIKFGEAFRLPPGELWRLQKDAVEGSFLPEDEKKVLLETVWGCEEKQRFLDQFKLKENMI